jgi:hypothetical protein
VGDIGQAFAEGQQLRRAVRRHGDHAVIVLACQGRQRAPRAEFQEVAASGGEHRVHAKRPAHRLCDFTDQLRTDLVSGAQQAPARAADEGHARIAPGHPLVMWAGATPGRRDTAYQKVALALSQHMSASTWEACDFYAAYEAARDEARQALADWCGASVADRNVAFTAYRAAADREEAASLA